MSVDGTILIGIKGVAVIIGEQVVIMTVVLTVKNTFNVCLFMANNSRNELSDPNSL